MDHVAAMLAAQRDRTPHAIALVDGARRLTYCELHARADHLAHALAALGVTRESRVGVCCERGAEMIIAIVAIGKAGGAYVPTDPDYPAARRDFIVDDAGLAIVVTQRHLADRFTVRTVLVEDPGTAMAAPAGGCAGEDAMFVLYTSGSTGQPKGVVCTHAAVASRLRWQQAVYPFAPGEVASARTTLGFVDSVAEIFAPLAFGVPLIVIGGAAQRDPMLAVAELAAAGATRITLVPSLLATMLDVMPDLAARAPSLRYWFVGGEPVPVPLAGRFRRALPGRSLINIYGATELTADATAYDFDAMPDGLATAPIGTPLPGVHARIVDTALREVADGETGELVISGTCLARGYLGRPELTAERFVDNPFPEGGRLYRTRDLGRRLPSGDIQYLGRLDQLVKIRGFRVELGEVEAVASAAPGVAHAVAVARDQQLVAFYASDRARPVSELRAFVAARLPLSSVPNRFVHVAQFPLNANGKVDRAALAVEPLPASDGGPPPATDDERRIAAVWQDVLGAPAIGRDASFFDLGGTSLCAMRAVAKLRELHGIELPVAALFEAPTVAGLARRLAEARPGAVHRPLAATARPLPAILPLSDFQFPFWMFRALTGSVSVIADVFAFTEPVDVARLQAAFARTVARFDTLWMRYPRWRPIQALAPRRPHAFEVQLSDDVEREAMLNITRPFDLMAPPHVHARLVRTRDGDELVLAIPHVAADLASLELFRRALEAAYEEREVAPVPATANLLDLVEWERTLGDPADDVRYWAAIARGPATNRLPARMFARGRQRAWSARPVGPGVIARLATRARDHAITLPIAMIGAIYAGLARAAGLDDPTVLVILEKRDRAELRDLFGNLTTVMGCRVADARAPVGEVAARVGRQLVASAEHTDHLMRRPTLWNDFWTRAPRIAQRLVGRLPPLAAEYVRALVPAFEPKRDRVMFSINILPEVTTPTEGARIVRRRALPEMLMPGDLVTGADALLDRTLQVHVTNAGVVVVNLYGGGLAQHALDEINEHIARALAELA